MKFRQLSLAVVSSLVLVACGGGKNSPDEFSVVNRPPLVIPPEAELAPPRPGEPKAQEMDPGRRAFEALFPGKEYKPSPPKSRSENGLLSLVGAGDPNVRSNVGQGDLDVVQKAIILNDLLEMEERTLRPDNVDVVRVASGDDGSS